MRVITVISGLSALAHQGRLDLFRLLVRAGHAGVPAGQLAERTRAAFTTTSALLTVLTNAGLITNRRAGRSIICAADFGAIRALFPFLLEDYCQARPETLQDLLISTTNPTPSKEEQP